MWDSASTSHRPKSRGRSGGRRHRTRTTSSKTAAAAATTTGDVDRINAALERLATDSSPASTTLSDMYTNDPSMAYYATGPQPRGSQSNGKLNGINNSAATPSSLPLPTSSHNQTTSSSSSSSLSSKPKRSRRRGRTNDRVVVEDSDSKADSDLAHLQASELTKTIGRESITPFFHPFADILEPRAAQRIKMPQGKPDDIIDPLQVPANQTQPTTNASFAAIAATKKTADAVAAAAAAMPDATISVTDMHRPRSKTRRTKNRKNSQSPSPSHKKTKSKHNHRRKGATKETMKKSKKQHKNSVESNATHSAGTNPSAAAPSGDTTTGAAATRLHRRTNRRQRRRAGSRNVGFGSSSTSTTATTAAGTGAGANDDASADAIAKLQFEFNQKAAMKRSKAVPNWFATHGYGEGIATERQLRKLWQHYDRDHNGFLEPDEALVMMIHFLKSVRKWVRQLNPKASEHKVQRNMLRKFHARLEVAKPAALADDLLLLLAKEPSGSRRAGNKNRVSKSQFLESFNYAMLKVTEKHIPMPFGGAAARLRAGEIHDKNATEKLHLSRDDARSHDRPSVPFDQMLETPEPPRSRFHIQQM
jgi:hypothetical protein